MTLRHYGNCLIILCCMLLIGCGTVSFSSSTPSTSQYASEPTRRSITVSTPRADTTLAATKQYTYGRFTVQVTDSGQQIVGGKFLPAASMPVEANQPHVLIVDYATKELAYYRQQTDGVYAPIVGYAVVTPLSSSLPRDVVRGRVQRINTAPTWCPTVNIRRAHPELPAGCVPYGHPLNAMGEVKFEIDWDVPNFSAVRLHGTTGYPEGNFWEEETFGCTRLTNTAIKELVATLSGDQAVREGVEVVLMRGSDLTQYAL